MDKEILCIVPSILSNEDEKYIIYSDNTYRCSHWEDENDFSQWKILEGKYFDVKHSNSKTWTLQNYPVDLTNYEPDEETKMLIEQIQLALAIKQMVEE